MFTAMTPVYTLGLSIPAPERIHAEGDLGSWAVPLVLTHYTQNGPYIAGVSARLDGGAHRQLG
jgi:hypothetical protein